MARKNMYIKDEAAAAAKRNRTGAEYTAYAPAPVAAAGTYYAPAPAASPVSRAGNSEKDLYQHLQRVLHVNAIAQIAP